MSQKADIVHYQGNNISICEFYNGGSKGFWIYDDTRGMNLTMRAKTERDAFIESIVYYQKRLAEVEGELRELSKKVDSFVSQFTEEEND